MVGHGKDLHRARGCGFEANSVPHFQLLIRAGRSNGTESRSSALRRQRTLIATRIHRTCRAQDSDTITRSGSVRAGKNSLQLAMQRPGRNGRVQIDLESVGNQGRSWRSPPTGSSSMIWVVVKITAS
jgi:hypothetical protein